MVNPYSTFDSTPEPTARQRSEESYAADAEVDRRKMIYSHVRVLAFDQTLTNCGWAVYDAPEQTVEACGVIKPEPAYPCKSFELTFEKARLLEEGLVKVLTEHAKTVDVIVMEMPAVTGYRTESSLMAAEKILTVCRNLGLAKPVMVARNTAAAVVAGNGKATKQQTSQVVNEIVKNRPKAPWNEHVRDAVLLALTEAVAHETRAATGVPSYEQWRKA